jgi:hypothetical protein
MGAHALSDGLHHKGAALLAMTAESKKERRRHWQIPTKNFIGLTVLFHEDAEGK